MLRTRDRRMAGLGPGARPGPGSGRAGLLVFAALCTLLAGTLSGCRSLTRPGDAPVPLLTQADALYETSEYEGAAEAYRQVLERHPGEATDRVLFRLAMIHLLPGTPVPDPESARVYLNQLIDGFPDSPLAEPARLVLDLQQRVEALAARSTEQSHKITELTGQLEALKRIDLERTKPPPHR